MWSRTTGKSKGSSSKTFLFPEGPATSLGTDHIDCAVKITLTTMVQARQAQLRRNPDAASCSEGEHCKRVLIVWGLSGDVVLLQPQREESAYRVNREGPCSTQRAGRVCPYTDELFAKLVGAFKTDFAHLVCVALDTVHVKMPYESAFARQKTPCSSTPRRLMSKFVARPYDGNSPRLADTS